MLRLERDRRRMVGRMHSSRVDFWVVAFRNALGRRASADDGEELRPFSAVDDK